MAENTDEEYTDPAADAPADESPKGTQTDGAEAGGEDGGGDQPPKDGEEEPDYRGKFSESSKENQRILADNKRIAEENATLRESNAKLQTLSEELRLVAGEANPDGTKILDLEKSIRELQTNIALSKEATDVNAFIGENPEAAKVSDSLRKLYRLNPTKSLSEIWAENFAPLVQATKEGAAAKKATQTKTQPEKTGGSVSGDPSASALPADFNKWSIAERKAYLQKRGY